MRWQAGCNHDKSKSHTTGWATHKLETVVPKKFSLCCEGSEPHVRLPSLGIQQRDWEPAGNLTLKGRGFDYRAFTELGETDSTLRTHKQNLACTRTQGKGAVTRQYMEPDTCQLEGLLWRWGSAVTSCGDNGIGSSSLGRCPLANEPSWRSP